MREIVVGGLLCIQSYWDLRDKEIPSVVSIIGGLLGLCMMQQIEKSGIEIILSLLPGVICLFGGWVTREAVGYGDGILLCMLGIYYTLEEIAGICLVAIVAAGVWGLVLFIFFHKSGSYEIPFVPFLLFGWLTRMLVIYGRF